MTKYSIHPNKEVASCFIGSKNNSGRVLHVWIKLSIIVFSCPGIQWQHKTWWCELVVCWGTEAGGSPMSAWAQGMTSRSSSYRWCTATASPEEPRQRCHGSRTCRASRLFEHDWLILDWESPFSFLSAVCTFLFFLRPRIYLAVFHISIGVQNWSATRFGCSGELQSALFYFLKASKVRKTWSHDNLSWIWPVDRQSHRMPLNFYRDVKAENRRMLFQSEEKTSFFLSFLPLSQFCTILGSSSSFSFSLPLFSFTVQSTLCLKKKRKKRPSSCDRADRSAAFSVLPQCGIEGFTYRRTASRLLFRLQTVCSEEILAGKSPERLKSFVTQS